MANYWSVSDEEAEFTKHLIRHFIIAKKLGVPPATSKADLAKLNDIWYARESDDVQFAEYKQIWNLMMDEWVEHQIGEANNVR